MLAQPVARPALMAYSTWQISLDGPWKVLTASFHMLCEGPPSSVRIRMDRKVPYTILLISCVWRTLWTQHKQVIGSTKDQGLHATLFPKMWARDLVHVHAKPAQVHDQEERNFLTGAQCTHCWKWPTCKKTPRHCRINSGHMSCLSNYSTVNFLS